MTRDEWEYGTQRRKPRPLWECIVAAGLVLTIIFLLAKGCKKEVDQRTEQTKAASKDTRNEIKRNTDTITVAAGKVQQTASNVLNKAEKRQQQAKENIYKPTPSETDSITLERANWLRGKN